jgi:ubiquinone/menaquinone biosynthesis C-methylase UbiE
MMSPMKVDVPSAPAAEPAPHPEAIAGRAWSERKNRIRQLSDQLAQERDKWIARSGFYYREDHRYLRFLIPEGSRVLDLGCGTGKLLAELKPARGVGIDLSRGMIEVARSKHPELEFYVGDVESKSDLNQVEGPFDVILLSDTIGSLDDCEQTLRQLHRFCTNDTRIIVTYYSRLWEPLLTLGEWVRLKMPQEQQNSLSTDDIINLLELAEFELVKREWRQLAPNFLFGLGWLLNRYLAPWPGIRQLCLRNYIVARPLAQDAEAPKSVTVVIPCRNERGNIEPAVRRMPRFCDDLEVIFVEGHSADGTLEEVKRVVAAYPEWNLKVMVQDGKGKGDAVRKGFAHAQGEVLMILDADLTVPPEALPKFYRALTSGKGEFVNGSRMVYPMQKDAMRFLNWVANQSFSLLFSWLLNQRFTDTLCGTKALRRENYQRIEAGRSYFGDFDPFGDFDLIFGAAKLNLKVVEVPITYASRVYGETQISRFRHGWLLFKMVVFAFRKLKAF